MKKNIKTGKYIKWIQKLIINPDSTMATYGSLCRKGNCFCKIQILSIIKILIIHLKY